MGSNEEDRQVVGGDVAGDGLVVAGRAGVFEDSLVVARVNPNELEGSSA